MDIDKFIEENKVCADDLYMRAEQVILVDDLKELLKTHSIVPNEPTEAMLDVVRRDYDGPGYCFTETYEAMLEASQENNQ